MAEDLQAAAALLNRVYLLAAAFAVAQLVHLDTDPFLTSNFHASSLPSPLFSHPLLFFIFYCVYLCFFIYTPRSSAFFFFFFFNDTATTEIYTLSLHDALPIRHLAELEPTTLAIMHGSSY